MGKGLDLIITGDNMAKQIKYSFWIGLLKTLKSTLIMWGPAIIAFLTNVPVQYAGIASAALYLFKNWYENSKGKKLF